MNEKIKQRIDTVRRGEVPEGYLRTRAGIMPTDWPTKTLAKDVFKSHTNKKHGGAYEVLSATQDRGIIPRKDVDIDIKYDEENISSYKKVDKGDFVISLRSFQGGIEYSEYEGLVSPAYTVLKAIKPIDDNYYRAYFKTADFIKRLNGAVYGIRDGKQIGFEDFGDLAIHYPSLAEQQKIAEILSTCDHVIELKQQLLDEKRKQKQWLRQMLLDPDSGVRLPGFEDEWSTRTFNDICVFINGRAYKQDELLEAGKYPVLRVGNLFTKSEWYYSDMELPSHMYIDNGDLIYAWSASFGPRIWQGNKVIFHYHIWKVMPSESVCKEYLYQYFQYDVDLLNREQQGGTMAHITKETMEKRLCRYPTLPEQKRISEILNAADRDIALTEQELEAWQQKKKALMQLLLTGLVRVNA